MSVFKNTKVGEKVTVQFRAEAFNVLNHPNPGYGVNGAATCRTSSSRMPVMRAVHLQSTRTSSWRAA